MLSLFLDLFSLFIHSELILTLCGIVFPFYLFYAAFSIIKYVITR